MKIELNSKNIITAIDILTIPVVTFNMNKINLNNGTQKNDAKLRKQFTCNRIYHPKSDVDRLYLPIDSGDMNIIQLVLSYKCSTLYIFSFTRFELIMVRVKSKTLILYQKKPINIPAISG